MAMGATWSSESPNIHWMPLEKGPQRLSSHLSRGCAWNPCSLIMMSKVAKDPGDVSMSVPSLSKMMSLLPSMER